MIIHHVIDSVQALSSGLYNSLGYKTNCLVAANALLRDKRLMQYTKEIRKCSDSFILDSGFLGMAKQGNLDWKNEQNQIIELGLKINADRIAALDIPCEPHILKNVGLSVNEALKVTYDNSVKLLQDNRLDKKRIISVQGWTLDERKKSLEMLYPLIEQDAQAWIGGGSTCMLTPKMGLFKIYEWLCSELPNKWIHAWGIAQPKWLVVMQDLGVSSCDSATAGIAAKFNEVVSPVDGTRTKALWHGKRNSLISAADCMRNMYALEFAFENLSGKKTINNHNKNSLF